MPRSSKQAPVNPDAPVVETPQVSTQDSPKSTEAAPKVAPVVPSQSAPKKKTPLKTEKTPSGAIIETF